METLAGVPIIGGTGPRTRSSKIRIAVGMPTLKWACTSGIADLMLTLGYMTYSAKSPYAFDSIMSSGSSNFSYPADYQRNMIAKKFLEGKCDWLWFIDSDILPPANVLELLKLLPEADVIAGIYPLMSRPPDPPVCWTCYDIVDTPTGGSFRLRDITRDHEIVRDAGGAATGMMLIHRRVLEDPRMWLAPEADPIGIFKLNFEPNGRPMNTEDMAFCKNLHKNGYKLIVHTGVRCGHVKVEDVTNVQEAMDLSFTIGYKCGLARDTDFCRTERLEESTRSDDANVGVPAEVAVN